LLACWLAGLPGAGFVCIHFLYAIYFCQFESAKTSSLPLLLLLLLLLLFEIAIFTYFVHAFFGDDDDDDDDDDSPGLDPEFWLSFRFHHTPHCIRPTILLVFASNPLNTILQVKLLQV